jgi:hypothetical protein
MIFAVVADDTAGSALEVSGLLAVLAAAEHRGGVAHV